MMNYVYSGIVSFVVGMLVFFLQSVLRENNDLKKKNKEFYTKEQAAMKDAIVCILRDILIENHKKYTTRKSISTHGLQNWLSMYRDYKILGGNGMVDRMKEEIEELHIG